MPCTVSGVERPITLGRLPDNPPPALPDAVSRAHLHAPSLCAFAYSYVGQAEHQATRRSRDSHPSPLGAKSAAAKVPAAIAYSRTGEPAQGPVRHHPSTHIPGQAMSGQRAGNGSIHWYKTWDPTWTGLPIGSHAPPKVHTLLVRSCRVHPLDGFEVARGSAQWCSRPETSRGATAMYLQYSQIAAPTNYTCRSSHLIATQTTTVMGGVYQYTSF